MNTTMNTGAESLLPCPFCGCSVNADDITSRGVKRHTIKCTVFDNVVDKMKKGRHLRGTMFSWAKLDEKKVQQIRADPRPQRAIAKDFGISRSAVSEIKTRKKWKHVPEIGANHE